VGLGVGLMLVLGLSAPKNATGNHSSALARLNVQSMSAAGGATSPRAAFKRGSPPKASATTTAENPQLAAAVAVAAAAAEAVVMLSGYALTRNRVGLWQKRFFELSSGDLHLHYYPDDRKDKSNSKGITLGGQIDLRFCSLVSARSATLTLHLHDKTTVSIRFDDAAEAARWKRGVYQVAKGLHAYTAHAPAPMPSDSRARANGDGHASGNANASANASERSETVGVKSVDGSGPDDGGYWRFLAGCKGDEAAATKRLAMLNFLYPAQRLSRSVCSHTLPVLILYIALFSRMCKLLSSYPPLQVCGDARVA
jgi:hypothetical protein